MHRHDLQRLTRQEVEGNGIAIDPSISQNTLTRSHVKAGRG
jgi:hypothetical protein